MRFPVNNTRAANLTPTEVLDIRAKYRAGKSQGALAREYTMSVVQIGRIVRRESWAQIPDVVDFDASARMLLQIQEETRGTSRLQAQATEQLKGNLLVEELKQEGEENGGPKIPDAGYE